MATVNITTHLTVTLGSAHQEVVKEYGSLATPFHFDITNGLVHEVRAIVADDYGVEKLWGTGDGNLDNFELLWFLSDVDVFLELRSDMAADEFILIEVKADVPLILTSDDMAGHDTASRLDGAVLVEATDYAQVDQITVGNDAADAAGDAKVHLVLFA